MKFDPRLAGTATEVVRTLVWSTGFHIAEALYESSCVRKIHASNLTYSTVRFTAVECDNEPALPVTVRV